jgi:hypothetical protein
MKIRRPCCMMTIGIVLAQCLFCSDGAAQVGFDVGIKSGWIHSTQWSSQDVPEGSSVETHAIDGLTLGVGFRVAWNSVWSVETDVLFSEMGASHSVTPSDFPFGPMELTYQCDYLDIPVFLQVRLCKSRYVSLFSTGGIYAGFLLNNQYWFHNDVWGDAQREMKNICTTDFGFIFGNGIRSSIWGMDAVLEYRFLLGLADISFPTDPQSIPFVPGEFFPVIKMRNMAHMVVISIGTHLKKKR